MTNEMMSRIPAWLLTKTAGPKYAGFLVCCINDGLWGVVRETPKAYLIEVSNDFSQGPAGWQFWVAKSLLG